jgi:hypothetical protein
VVEAAEAVVPRPAAVEAADPPPVAGGR